MKRIIKNDEASVYPVAIFIIVLGVASMLILLLGHVVEPFMNLMESPDDDIKTEISRPRGLVSQFVQIIWPKGVLLFILVGASMGLLMEYQKSKYQQG